MNLSILDVVFTTESDIVAKKNTYVQISGNIYAPKFLEMSSIILKSASTSVQLKKNICPHLDLKVEMASTGTHFNFQIYVFYYLEIN